MGEPLLIQVPYHLGREREGMGAGPPVLAEAIGGESIVVDRGGPFSHEVGASFDVLRALAAAVREAVGSGRFPLVLAGNCASSVGTVAGLSRDDVGVVWLDAHPDFHTPETTETGFFDGFGLALLTGSGWDTMRASIDGHRPVPEEHVVLVARDPDPGERRRLDASRVIEADAVGVLDALETLRARVPAVYLHVDLDVLDPSEAQANSFAVPGGLSAEQLLGVVGAVRERFELVAAAITAYNPEVDPEERVPGIARRLADALTREEARACPPSPPAGSACSLRSPPSSCSCSQGRGSRGAGPRGSRRSRPRSPSSPPSWPSSRSAASTSTSARTTRRPGRG